MGDAEAKAERTAQLLLAFARAATLAQEARSIEGIFAVAREQLRAMDLSVFFAEARGDGFAFFESDGFFRGLAEEVLARRGEVVPLAATPIQQAIRKQPDGVFIEHLAPLLAQALQRPLEELAIAPGVAALGAAIPVGEKLEFTVTAAGPDLERALAPAFGLFARQLGFAIETSRRLEELWRKNRELTLVNQVAHDSAALGSGRSLEPALSHLMRSLSLDGIALLRSEGHELVLAMQEGMPEAWVSRAGRVALRAETPWSEAARGAEMRVFALRSAGDSAALPLRTGAELQGVLVATRAKPLLGPDELGLLTTLGAQLAVSLQNELLFQQTQRRVRELSLLLELGQAVAGSLDQREIFRSGTQAVVRVLRCSAAYVFVPDAEKTSLACAAHEDPLSTMPAEVRLPLDRPSVSALAFRTGKPQLSANALADPRIDPELNSLFGCRSTLAVPLRAHEHTLGVLVLIERSAGRSFDAQDTRLAVHAAQLLAASAENAALYAEQRRRAEEMTLLEHAARQMAGLLKRTQSELVDRERLAMLGELSASIAHEVRNPLGVIFNALGSLRRMLQPDGNVGLLLGIIGEEADRLNRMVADLLDYSRPYQPTLQPVPLVPLVEDALVAARTQSGIGTKARTDSDEGMQINVRIPLSLTLRADPRLLRQALINLFLNAFQAMPKGGTLDVIAERARGPGGDEAQILIRDSGPGIMDAVRERIFHPFFTTKATGTGLGLAVVKRIVDGHQGRIALRDGEETGAEFELWLPVAE